MDQALDKVKEGLIVLAWVDCAVEAEYPAGDHMIVIGRVTDLVGGVVIEEADEPDLAWLSPST